MALGAGDLLGRCLVNRPFYIGMTIHAGEHASVDGVLELVFVYRKTDFLAVYFLRQGGIGVAGKAIFVLRFLRRMGCRCPHKQGNRNSLGQKFSCSGHT